MTPTADALKGLVGAADDIARGVISEADPADGLTGKPPWCANCGAEVARPDPNCEDCRLRAALAAFESRGRLRDDAELLHAAYGPLYRTLGIGIAEGAALAADILDAVESALLGTPGTGEEGERRG